MRWTLFPIIFFLTNMSFAQDSLNVTQIGRLYYNWGPYIHSIVVSGDNAFISTLSTGLRILDISDPQNPYEVGYCAEGVNMRGLCVEGDYVYAAGGFEGLFIIDVGDPENPEIIGIYDSPGSAVNVFISGDYAYLADDGPGVRIIDISDPTSPEEVSYFDPLYEFFYVIVYDNYAYMTNARFDLDDAGGLYIVDVTDPTDPDEVGFLETPHHALKIAYVNGYIYLEDYISRYLRIIDVSEPSNPFFVEDADSLVEAVNMAVSGDRMYLASSSFLKIYDVTNPTSPELLGTIETEPLGDIDAAGDYVYTIADYGVTVFNVNDPSDIQIAGGYHTAANPWDMDISETHAFVSDEDGIRVIDLSDCRNPQEVSIFAEEGSHEKLKYYNGYLYSSHYAGLVVTDVSDPENPERITTYDSVTYADDIDVNGNYLYNLSFRRLKIIDISNPGNPELVGEIEHGTRNQRVRVSGEYAFVNSSRTPFTVIDVSDPSSPVVTETLDEIGRGIGLAVSGDYVYAANWDTTGIYTYIVIMHFDGELEVVGEIQVESIQYNLVVSGNFLFSTGVDGKILVIDISDPTDTGIVGYYYTGEYSNYTSIKAIGDYAFYMDEKATLRIFDCSEATGGQSVQWNELSKKPDDFTIMSAYPNPFNSSLTISYNIPAEGVVSISIMNVLGQQISRSEFWSQPGINRFSLSEHQNHHNMASGNYYMLLQHDGIRKIRKFTLLK
ncbi:MAG: T9SS type A sorting domain-containing protein [Candidatus Electryonea clarkiae]|nr:T9SS type A sorting domain-containing protein [Candidatus Electryonea clarkiae]MDP8287227.1 T9SS type A sorting domain-containing protein [Candidatus Electryonea clarkiae]